MKDFGYYLTDFDGINVHKSGEDGFIECDTLDEAIQVMGLIIQIECEILWPFNTTV